jgi:excisionase family DNA binding protein
MSDDTIVPRLLTVKEVSKLLRIHRPKVYELIKRGDIAGFKLGADWRVKTESVELYVGAITSDILEAINKKE